MIGSDDLIHLIGGCYAAARDGAGASWAALIARLARSFAADQAVLLGYDAARREPWARIAHGGAHGGDCALLDRLGATLADAPRLAGPAWSPGKPFASRPQLAASIDHQLGLVDEIEPGVILAVGMFRARGGAPFTPASCAALGRLAPHLASAARIARQLATARATAAAIGETLEKLSAAVMIVDRGARVVSATRAARGLVAMAGIAIRAGALRVERPADDRALRAALAAVLGAADQAPDDATCCVPGRDSAPPVRDLAIHGVGVRRLVLRVSALPPDVEADGGAAHRPMLAAIEVLSGSPAGDSRARVLAPAYRLSRAESELLDGLLGGMRLAEIAVSRGTSRETARSQLKSIFHKTGVATQSDLVALASRAAQLRAHGAAAAAR